MTYIYLFGRVFGVPRGADGLNHRVDGVQRLLRVPLKQTVRRVDVYDNLRLGTVGQSPILGADGKEVPVVGIQSAEMKGQLLLLRLSFYVLYVRFLQDKHLPVLSKEHSFGNEATLSLLRFLLV